MYLKILSHDNVGNLIAVLSFLLAAHSVLKNRRFEKKQAKINDLILKEKQKESLRENMAEISASFIKNGGYNNHTKLKIFNKGKAIAKNVNIIFHEDNDLISDDEIKEKFPLKLEQHQAVELNAITHLNMKRKIKFIATWDDDYSIKNEKEIELTL